jgi:hypothetical protein
LEECGSGYERGPGRFAAQCSAPGSSAGFSDGDELPIDQVEPAVLVNGTRILSAYRTRLNDRIWVITEADRSSTCILLREEY